MTEELKELFSEDGSRVYKEVEKALRSSPLMPRHGQSAYRARRGSRSRQRIT